MTDYMQVATIMAANLTEIAIVVTAIATVLLAFFTLKYIEQLDRQRQFELKRVVYFELLKVLSEIREIWLPMKEDIEMAKLAHKENKPKPLPSGFGFNDDEEVITIIPEFIKPSEDLDVMEYKLRLCGSSENIIKNVKLIKELLYVNPERACGIIEGDLIPELRSDLKVEAKHWWKSLWALKATFKVRK